jgi:hypothetical protein
MPVAMYYTWENQGRPWHAATPIREFIARLKLARPAGAGYIWSLGNQEHLEAVPAQDHTPYSQTGWPSNSPYPVVFACDVSHQPNSGLDCYVLFDYWITEARAGRMPWLKYLIWRAKRYDVRNNWSPVSSSGHFDHIHLSGRTDYEFYGLGGWSVVPVPPPPPPEEDEYMTVPKTVFRYTPPGEPDGLTPYWVSIGDQVRRRLGTDADVEFEMTRAGTVLFPGEDPNAAGFPFPDLADDPDWNEERVYLAFGPVQDKDIG